MIETTILRATPLFNGMREEEIGALCRDLGAYRRRYAARSFIWLRGQMVHTAGIVLRGSVQAERVGRDGELEIIARHHAGALFGEVLMGAQTKASPFDIVALADTEVLFLPLENMMREGAAKNAAAVTQFRLNLLGEISGKYWAQQQRVDMLVIRSLRGRIALWLLQEGGGEKRVQLPLTREMWAAQLGVNRSALSRELSRMAAEGLIELRRRTVHVPDTAALEEYTQ